ncbi:GSCOCG00006833001-RA-CDS, partial [Cotesia congregata]
NWVPGQPTVDEVSSSMQIFGIVDYVIFTLMLVSCGGIGIYFGFIKKSTGEDEYLVGGRNMKTFPVSLSLIASFFSGISLLGTPTEIYLTSTYEYLERRFDRKVRILGSTLFSIGIMLWLPIVIYVPALAFNQVTGVNVHIVTPFVCIICIFYTCVGGLRAVVWTDFVQAFIMFGAMLLVVIKGTADVGGLGVVLQRNRDSDRLELPMTDLSPSTRHTIWALVIGGFVHWLQSAAINQNMLQRYMSLPNLYEAKKALWIFIVGAVALIGVCGYSGLLIYAWYHECDPLTTKLVNAKDQLLPLLVMDVLGQFPGFPGLFVAGVFSAALSSLSTGLNSMAAVIFEDFIKPFRKTPFSTRTADILMKLTVVILGVVCVGLVFVVEKAGTHVLELTITMSAIHSGPSLGIFSIGILLPWVNAKGKVSHSENLTFETVKILLLKYNIFYQYKQGALIGGLCGLGFMGWVTFSAQAAIASGNIISDEKSVTTEGCTYWFQQAENLLLAVPPDSVFETTDDGSSETWAIYRVSYLWYTVTGALVTMSIGLMVSIISSESVNKLDPKLVAPFLRKYFKTDNSIELHQVQVCLIINFSLNTN